MLAAVGEGVLFFSVRRLRPKWHTFGGGGGERREGGRALGGGGRGERLEGASGRLGVWASGRLGVWAHLRSVASPWQVLLVGVHEEEGVLEGFLLDEPVQLLGRLGQARAIGGVDDENERLRRGEIVPPERAQLLLPTHVPDGELDVFVLQGLDIEADRRHGALGHAEFEAVEDRSLT